MTDHDYAITLQVGSSRANKTGTWRVERPVYVDRMPPCNDACPAGENIQRWLYLAEEARYESAWRALVEDNPLPATSGRICFHPCETACNRGQLDEAVGIHAVERFLGDYAIENGWAFEPHLPKTGKRILVVGSGPSGLSAAYHLALLGHTVEIFESSAKPGGMMRYGIPRYRLPRDILDCEIARIEELGIRITCGRHVDDVEKEMEKENFDAVYLAYGAQMSHKTAIPAADTSHIIEALDLLRRTEDDAPCQIGQRVVVYGGGDTAMDAARTARRLGATDAVIVYRRNRDRMPAHTAEFQEARAEGIRVCWLSTISAFEPGKVVVEKMELDETGFPRSTGEFSELGADSVVLALGQEADLSGITDLDGVDIKDGVVKVDANMMTGHRGVFAGGDMVPAERTATVAIGHGKKAARSIDRWLKGWERVAPSRPELASFERLNTWYYSDAPKQAQAELELARRESTFEEVIYGLDESNALFEARRCMSCGNCFECDNCYGVCPDNSVIKLGAGKRYQFNYDYCKGCGICVAECPCGAIEMVPELI
jgi:2-oxoacid:acceptor oxidoreductase delta subunit (pyruvate/2-ketoisovalerate family)